MSGKMHANVYLRHVKWQFIAVYPSFGFMHTWIWI